MITNTIFMFEQFAHLPNLIHGISTITIGDMKSGDKKTVEAIAPFAHALQIPLDHIVGMGQVHGKHVQEVSAVHGGMILDATDGLWTKENNVFVYGTFADCVPLLFYDRKTNMAGVAHAGWKGTLAGVAERLVLALIENGANTRDVLVGIGPSIRDCCYAIAAERAEQFAQNYSFPQSDYLTERDGTIYLSLQNVLTKQFLALGVQADHIEDAGICTHDSDDFFSYRKQNKPNNYKTFAALIGVR